MANIPEKQWNKRPQWCPHQECVYQQDIQGSMCKGKLLRPERHDNDFNTHRLCIDNRETGHGIFDLLINHTDAYLLRNLLNDI